MRLDVQFNPFTYEELIRPIADYNEAYKEVEEAYSILSEQAEAFRSEVNQHKNSEAYKTHSKYSNELNAIVDDFSQGMTRANRAKLLGMKRRYNTEIAPIAKAAARRSALAEEQRKMELANPTMLWERMASDMSLDEFINNPSADYGRSYSGAMLTQQVANAAANLAKEAIDSEEGRRKLKRILPYTYDMIQQNGFSRESVMKAILGSPDADSILTGLVDNALITSGIGTTNNPGWGNDAIRAKAYEYARQGLYNAIGQTTHQVIRDEAGLAARARQEAPQQQFNLSLTPNFDRRNVRTQEETAAISKDAEDWNKYKNYFYKTSKGNWAMTAEGRKQSLTYNTGHVSGRGIRYTESTHDTDFGKFIKRWGLDQMYRGFTGSGQSANINRRISAINNTYDANVATEYIRGIDSSQYDNVISALNRHSTEGEIYNYDRQNSAGLTRGKKVKVSELASTDIKSVSAVYGKHGDYIEIKLKDGTTLRDPISSFSSNYATMLTGNKGTIEGYRKMLAEGKTHYQLPNGMIYPIEALIISELNAMGDNIISSIGLSQANPTKVDRGEYATQVR